MSKSSLASLGALRILSKQRADLQYSTNLSDPEWNQNISNSAKELVDLLIGAYGNEYFVKCPYYFGITGAQFYPLPSDFYKLLGVDLQYSASPTGWITLKRFEFIERNKYAYPNTAINWNGYTNLKYRVMGNQLELIPIPMGGQNGRLWYIPEPASLQFMPTCSTTSDSATIGVSDTSDLSVGMSIYGAGIPCGATVTAIDASAGTVTISANATATAPIVILFFWTDAATIDGIAGWEEYVIVDAAIKAGIKQETDIQGLLMQKAAMKARIEAMAEGRDAGQAHHVSDAVSVNGYGGLGDGYGDDYGFGGGPF